MVKRQECFTLRKSIREIWSPESLEKDISDDQTLFMVQMMVHGIEAANNGIEQPISYAREEVDPTKKDVSIYFLI